MAETNTIQSLISAVPQTAIRVVTNPKAFFREMPKTGGFFEPLVFVAVMGTVAGIIQTVMNTILYFSMMSITAFLASLVFMPIVIALFSFVGAGVLFLIWKLMGSQENYETAYRGAAYLAALSPITTVVGLIPYLGTIISLAIGLYYIVIVSVAVHALPERKSWMVFGIIAAIVCLFSLSATYSANRLKSELGERSLQMEQMRKAAEQMQRSQQSGQTADQQKQIQDMQRMIDEMQKQQKK